MCIRDRGITQDYIGSVFYSFREINDRSIIGPHWAHLYGWPDDADADALAECKNMKPTEYKGSCLLSFTAEDDKGARVGKKKCEKAEEPALVQYEFRLDLFQVGELPEGVEDSEVYVTFGLGSTLNENNWGTSKTGKLEGNSCDYWVKDKKRGQYKLKTLWPAIKKSNLYLEKQVPDIFINLWTSPTFGSDKRIGFLRFEYDLKTCKHLSKDEIKWYPLVKDPFSGVVGKGEIPGFIQMRFQFGEKKKLPRAGGWPATRKADFLLRAHIYQGKELPAADAEGTSDAFCIMRMAGVKGQTKTIYCTCFPRWYETIELEVSLPTNTELLPNVYFLLYDEDEWGPPDYLGRFAVEAQNMSFKFKPDGELSDSDWYPLVTGEKDGVEETEGLVLASFQLIKKGPDIVKLKNSGQYGPHPEHPDGLFDIYPEHFSCIFECFIVGIRDLEPYNLLECSDPIIEIDCGDRSAEKIAETEQGETPNMSWKEQLQIECELPSNIIFAPNLNVRVYDNRMLGKTQVGSSSIPVAPYMSWTNVTHEPAVPEGVEFPDNEEEDEEDEQPPQDILPTDRIEMNETVHPVFKEFVFDTIVRGGQIGQRSIPETKPISIGGEEEEEMEGGSKKKDPVKDRPCLEKDWETSEEGFTKDNPPPFHVYDVMRGGGGGGGGMFSMLSIASVTKCVGKLKMRCRAYPLNSADHLDEATLEDRWAELGREKKMTLRVYLIRGISLMANDSDTNPFANVLLTNHEPVMDIDRTLRESTQSPSFYTYYEFKDVKMPGDHTLTIEIWDNNLMGNDLIGKAKVDLEDRHFTRSWWDKDISELKWRPKEWLPLWSTSSGLPQGRVEVWIDLLDDKEAGQVPIIPLNPPKGNPWELRVVCWKVTDLNFRDKTGVDLFCSGLLEFKSIEDDKMKRPVDRQDTDTQWFMEPQHYGSFHWRWIFPAQLPCTIPKLLVQTWDCELLTPNDAMCECNLQLGGFFKAADTKGTFHTVDVDLGMTHPNFRGIQGNIQLTLEMWPQDDAEDDPAEPGRTPELLEREGMYAYYRPPGSFPSFSLWPIIRARLLKYKKHCIGCCIGVVVVVGVAAIVMLSDERLKRNVQPWETDKYTGLGLTPVQWEWNEAGNKLGMYGAGHGVMAQEVMQHYSWPVVVQGSDGYHRVNYLLLGILSFVQQTVALLL
eukprot:TRINITY_DN7845_c0_g2_i4.p1 TRINITY_DN7845_c0_g2~~TRINITY_DN7845_c0_g2_i4.p1  ORF type:complete len:1170 (+),score=289.91 TRINITY_DN7845_c0_g2_i4:179-3688(+)